MSGSGNTQESGELLDRLYTMASLGQYTWSQRLTIRTAGLLLFWMIRAIGLTLRFEVIGRENFKEGQPVIFCFWHNRIPVATYFWRGRGIVVMSSRSFDSEYIARFIQRFKYGAARGSSTRGARAALIQMIRAVRAGKSAAFTVDGPRGPIYQAKPGPILLASKSGAPIVPFSISLDRWWKLPSWDGLQIPQPFARALVVIGAPIRIGNRDGESDLTLNVLQSALEKVRERSDHEVALRTKRL